VEQRLEAQEQVADVDLLARGEQDIGRRVVADAVLVRPRLGLSWRVRPPWARESGRSWETRKPE
jgi:hypothetical protein